MHSHQYHLLILLLFSLNLFIYWQIISSNESIISSSLFVFYFSISFSKREQKQQKQIYWNSNLFHSYSWAVKTFFLIITNSCLTYEKKQTEKKKKFIEFFFFVLFTFRFETIKIEANFELIANDLQLLGKNNQFTTRFDSNWIWIIENK